MYLLIFYNNTLCGKIQDLPHMKLFLRYWLPVLAYMALIFYLSSRSGFGVTVPSWLLFWDKFVHACIYGFLTLLCIRALSQGRWREAHSQVLVLSVLIASVYGITDEFHQSFVPMRSPSASDWVADTAGAILVAMGIYFRNTWETTSPGRETMVERED